ncbi:MAG: Gfo/Idh/MocA family oxidoreductase [Pseudomonadota bacterium]
MTPTRFGIIGYGKMGHIRREVIEKRDDAVVVATCDPYAGGDDFPHTSDWRELLARDDLDAVVIASTNELIPPAIIEALVKGLHVFSEKPPGRTLEDIINIRRAEAAAPGKILKFGFNHRYHYSVMEAKKIAESGELGGLISMRGTYGKAGGADYGANWRNNFDISGGGILIDQGVHMIDLMHLFAGPFEEVKGMMDDRFWTGLGVEDNAMALMRTNSGVMAMVHSSATQWRQTFRLELGFEKGYLWLDGILSNSMGYAPEMLIVGRLQRDENGDPIPNPKEDVRKFDTDDSWALEIAEFMDAVQDKAPIHTGTSQHAFDAMNAVQRIYAADPTFTHKTQAELKGDA